MMPYVISKKGKCNATIQLGALFVTISWCAVIYYGGFHGLSFLNGTLEEWIRLLGSPSQLAVDAAYNLMPHKLFENQFYAAVVVSSETENVIKADIVKNFALATGSSGRLWPEAERQKNL